MSPMDNMRFTPARQQQQSYNGQSQSCPVIPGMSEEMCNAMSLAQQNPQAFEQQVAQRNPQGYQQLMQIRNSANPKNAARQFCQQRGVPPHIMRMFGL